MPGGLVSLVYGRRLWDRDGREWTFDRPADVATTERLRGGTRPIAVYRSDDHAVVWAWPGEDPAGQAEVWRHLDEEMLAVRVHRASAEG